MKLEILDSMCDITKRVVNDFNTLDETGFFRKYSCSKNIYYNRVMKYGDPYMHAPLAKLGKFLLKLQNR